MATEPEQKPMRASMEDGQGTMVLLDWEEIQRLLPGPMKGSEFVLGKLRLTDHGLECDYAFSQT